MIEKISKKLEEVLTKEYFDEYIKVGFCREDDCKTDVKKKTKYDGIYMYMYLSIDSDDEFIESIRFNKRTFDIVGVFPEDAWDLAISNTIKDMEILELGGGIKRTYWIFCS